MYGQALWIIVSKCHQYTEFARSLLNDADHSEWGTVEHFDHRVLQHGHDLLAAVWRFRNDFQQPLLPFVDKKSLDELQTLWLGWQLRHEIAGWIDYPHRVRLVQLILTNQNELPGYIAEAQLSLDIINWFTVLAIIGKRIFLDFRRPTTGHANLVSGVGSAEMDRSSG